MSHLNSFFNFHNAIAKCLEATIASLARPFTGARLADRQRTPETGTSPAPPTKVAGDADSPLSKAQAEPEDDARLSERQRSPEVGKSPAPTTMLAGNADSTFRTGQADPHAFADSRPVGANAALPTVPVVPPPATRPGETEPASAATDAAGAAKPRAIKTPPAAKAAAPVAPAAVVADQEALPAAPQPACPVPAAPRPACPVPAADPELDALRERIAAMETRVVDLETRKAGMDQLLDEYAYCQYRAVGELLDEQLRLQKEVLQRVAERSFRAADRAAADAAAEEYAAYRQARQQPAAPPPVLAEDERQELTGLYRTIVMRCHPDRVGEAEKAQAHEMFLRTQDAYRRHDLDLMRLIDRQLAAGAMPASVGEGSAPRERLEALLDSLLDKGAGLLLAIQSLQMQANYRRARCREQWEDHFATARAHLEDECLALRRQLQV